MNFHIKCPKGWTYTGDVNIVHGGTFYRTADIESGTDSVEYVECRGVEGCDNQYIVTCGHVYVDPKTNPRIVAVDYGIPLEDVTRLHLVQWADGYFGGEEDSRYVVQVGKQVDPLAIDWEIAHVVLSGNAKIENYLIREHLKG